MEEHLPGMREAWVQPAIYIRIWNSMDWLGQGATPIGIWSRVLVALPPGWEWRGYLFTESQSRSYRVPGCGLFSHQTSLDFIYMVSKELKVPWPPTSGRWKTRLNINKYTGRCWALRAA